MIDPVTRQDITGSGAGFSHTRRAWRKINASIDLHRPFPHDPHDAYRWRVLTLAGDDKVFRAQVFDPTGTESNPAPAILAWSVALSA